ncbi:MAG: hypothetical protein AAF738_03625 [Bacteroidota bacterium]
MAVLLIFLTSFLFVSKSKYFPKEWQSAFAWFRNHPVWTRVFGYFLLAIAAYLFVQKAGVFTGIIAWGVVIMLAFSTVVMLIPFLHWVDRQSINS